MPMLAAWVMPVVLSAAAEPRATPHARVELIAERASVRPGEPLRVGLRFELEPGWHVYWRNPGDSGKAPELDWKLPRGFEAGELEWPVPERIEVGPLVNYGYEGEVLLATSIQSSKRREPATIALSAKWLVCEKSCVPGKADLSLTLPASDLQRDPGPHAGLFARTRELLPEPAPPGWKARFLPLPGKLVVAVDGASDALSGNVTFFPAEPGLIDHGKPQSVSREGGVIRIEMPRSDLLARAPGRIEGLVKSDHRAWAIEAHSASAPEGSLPAMLWLAFVGGLILNLMPCVFPVLFIKALGLAQQSGHSARAHRLQGLAYVTGVIVSFWALALGMIALQAGGRSLGWGFQLQSPAFVTVLAGLFFAISLNLLGVFEIGGAWGFGQKLASKGGLEGSFFTGVLAVVVATPCTAPFMGTAIGFAVTQRAPVSLAVFTALGFGLALPYCAVSWAPGISRILPRPGKWMETFRQAMAFPILATVIWLVWVLGIQDGIDRVARVLVALLALSIGLWCHGRWRKPWSVALALSLAAAGLWAGMSGSGSGRAGSRATEGWEPWSRARLAELQSVGRPAFVDFTAAWCVTCKVNEALALGDREVRDKMKEHGVVQLLADWTSSDPAITEGLAEFGRNGVPLYLLYSGRKGEPPLILPQILTPGNVLGALDRALSGKEKTQGDRQEARRSRD